MHVILNHFLVVNSLANFTGYILNEFAQQWIEEKPKDIMEFSRVRDKVFKQIKVKLRSDEPILEATFQKV